MTEVIIRITAPAGSTVSVEHVEEPPFPGEPQAPVIRTIAAAQPSPMWQVGSVHAQGHNPLKSNARGLYCPTKDANGAWCPWHP